MIFIVTAVALGGAIAVGDWPRRSVRYFVELSGVIVALCALFVAFIGATRTPIRDCSATSLAGVPGRRARSDRARLAMGSATASADRVQRCRGDPVDRRRRELGPRWEPSCGSSVRWPRCGCSSATSNAPHLRPAPFDHRPRPNLGFEASTSSGRLARALALGLVVALLVGDVSCSPPRDRTGNPSSGSRSAAAVPVRWLGRVPVPPGPASSLGRIRPDARTRRTVIASSLTTPTDRPVSTTGTNKVDSGCRSTTVSAPANVRLRGGRGRDATSPSTTRTVMWSAHYLYDAQGTGSQRHH